ncbi:hypothetical protein [Pontibacter sp. G13]|uniref:hypothetical protein n=1 Tax=Pontibacter sp. G13 TaxID=3074898 RepID=UPI002889691A|nr:hypothetical protein [Pontibacter sp. G13]WNJ17139.1 hypothetical protein RJD25_19970 [Pontibacter sp. G13]
MKIIRPDFENLGYADQMGPKLKMEVENQLLIDLKFYKVDQVGLRFDWSDSCIEGNASIYLDGTVENFSGIAVFDSDDNFCAGGWMDFIHEGEFFIAYWEFVKTWSGQKKLMEKKRIGIPDHVWTKLPDEIKPIYRKFRI